MFAVTFAKLTFLLCAYLYVLVYVCVFHNGTQSTFIYFNPLTHNGQIRKRCKIFKVCLTILGHYALKG